MGTPERPGAAARQRRWQRVGLALLGVLLALVLLVVFFPWDLLRGPLNRYVSERTGRTFEITRHLDVRLGRTITVVADGIVFANPQWAREPYLVQAEGAEIQLRLGPLLQRRVVIPQVLLHRPRLGLETREDGRRTWSLDPQGGAQGAMEVEELVVDQGRVRYIAPHQGADIEAEFAIDARDGAAPAAPRLPLSFRAEGRWRGEPFTAQGRTGSVLVLRRTAAKPFPLEVSLSSGTTSLQASGTVRVLASLEGADLGFQLRGRNLADLYRLTDVVLPATPPYAVRGHLRREGPRWQFTRLAGQLGRSDVAGALTLDRGRDVPVLSGALESRLLDFDDLAPLVGLRYPPGKSASAPARPGDGVLPVTAIDLSRLRRMDADVRFTATRVVNVRRLPLDRMATHVRLRGGVLDLAPLELGVAGGKLGGKLRLDGTNRTAQVGLDLQASNLQLQKLFPGVELNQASVGLVQGRVELEGRGNTVAQMLGSASGDVALLMGRGRISNLLLELAGLDGAEIMKFMMGRDQRIELRCAAAAFEVRQGVMRSRVLLLDTADTVVQGEGAISLADETINLTFYPYPKDKSILSLRSPLKLTGTLGAPDVGLDKRSLVARAGIAIALGALNPLLGLASTVETGPGKDADCGAVLKAAATPAAQQPAQAAPNAAPRPGRAPSSARP